MARIAVVEKAIHALRDLMDERAHTSGEALKIQTQELARRLDALNGEAERLRLMQATYVPREVYETKVLQVERAIRNLENFRENLIGRMTITAAVVAALSVLLSAVVIRWVVP